MSSRDVTVRTKNSESLLRECLESIGLIARKYTPLTKRQVIKEILLPPIYEAYWAFKKKFWFTLSYFRLVQGV